MTDEQGKKKRDWNKVKRTCLICKHKDEQGNMIRWENGYICQDCYRRETVLYEIEEW